MACVAKSAFDRHCRTRNRESDSRSSSCRRRRPSCSCRCGSATTATSTPASTTRRTPGACSARTTRCCRTTTGCRSAITAALVGGRQRHADRAAQRADQAAGCGRAQLRPEQAAGLRTRARFRHRAGQCARQAGADRRSPRSRIRRHACSTTGRRATSRPGNTSRSGRSSAKSFASTMSPWIVTLEALEPFRCAAFPRSGDQPAPLAYLSERIRPENGNYDIQLEVHLRTGRCAAAPPVAQQFPPRVLDAGANRDAPGLQRLQSAARRPARFGDDIRAQRPMRSARCSR